MKKHLPGSGQQNWGRSCSYKRAFVYGHGRRNECFFAIFDIAGITNIGDLAWLTYCFRFSQAPILYLLGRKYSHSRDAEGKPVSLGGAAIAVALGKAWKRRSSTYKSCGDSSGRNAAGCSDGNRRNVKTSQGSKRKCLSVADRKQPLLLLWLLREELRAARTSRAQLPFKLSPEYITPLRRKYTCMYWREHRYRGTWNKAGVSPKTK